MMMRILLWMSVDDDDDENLAFDDVWMMMRILLWMMCG
jgi:hypothetical protein